MHFGNPETRKNIAIHNKGLAVKYIIVYQSNVHFAMVDFYKSTST